MYWCLNRALVFTTFFMLPLVAGCGGDKEPTCQEEADISTQDILDLLLEVEYEKAALLASKHKLPENQVRTIIKEYMLVHDPTYRLLTKAMRDEGAKNIPSTSFNDMPKISISETLRNLSMAHNIPEDIIASLIIDYRIWSAAAECANDL